MLHKTLKAKYASPCCNKAPHTVNTTNSALFTRNKFKNITILCLREFDFVSLIKSNLQQLTLKLCEATATLVPEVFLDFSLLEYPASKAAIMSREAAIKKNFIAASRLVLTTWQLSYLEQRKIKKNSGIRVSNSQYPPELET